MSKIEVSTPGKLMLFGEHSVVYGRPCIVTAADQRMRVVVEIEKSSNLQLIAPEVGLSNYLQNIDNLGKSQNIPKGARFVETAVKNFFEKYNIRSGLKIETRSEFSSKFGFGSSSAVTVGVIKALSELFKLELCKQELFDLSYKTVLDVQGVGSGFDLTAAIWGGTIYFKTGGEVIEPIKVLEFPLVVGYTGIKADTPTLIRQVADLHQKNESEVENIFDQIAILTEEAKKALMSGDLKTAGRLMNLNQELLNQLGVSTNKLTVLIEAARGAGAYGAKLSGAGGGDCMISLIQEDNRIEVEEAITKVGGTVLKVETNAEGVNLK